MPRPDLSEILPSEKIPYDKLPQKALDNAPLPPQVNVVQMVPQDALNAPVEYFGTDGVDIFVLDASALVPGTSTTPNLEIFIRDFDPESDYIVFENFDLDGDGQIAAIDSAQWFNPDTVSDGSGLQVTEYRSFNAASGLSLYLTASVAGFTNV